MHLRLETISPSKAAKYLETNHGQQRHIKPSKVERFSNMIIDGTFNGENGETIKFAKNGKGDVLIDGQHRLEAIVLSGKSVKIGVLRGLKMSSFETLDQNDVRTIENFYQIANQSHAKICAQVAKWLYYNEVGGSPLRWVTAKYGPVPIHGLIAKHGLENYPDLPDVIDRSVEYLNQFQRKGLGTRNHLAYCYYLWQKIDQIQAHDFVRYLGAGEGNVCQTIVSLREYLMTEGKRDRENAIPGTQRGIKIINALNAGWNAVQSGKKNVKSFSRIVSKFDKSINGLQDARHINPVQASV